MAIVPRITSCFKRKAVLLTATLLLCLLAVPVLARAGEVIVVKDSGIKPYLEAVEGFKSACGCPVREIELSDIEALERAVKARPAAVVAVGTESFRKVSRLKTVPVIYTMVIPSETADLSADNLSGVSMELDPALYLSAIAELFPAAKKVGILFDPSFTGAFVQDALRAAGDKGITLVQKIVRDSRSMPAHLDELYGKKIDVLWLLPDATVSNPDSIEYLMLFSFQHNIPVFSFSRKTVSLGAVAALSVSPHAMGTQAGEITRRLLQGEKGPVRAYAQGPRMIVNKKVAAKIGVRINGKIAGHAETVD